MNLPAMVDYSRRVSNQKSTPAEKIVRFRQNICFIPPQKKNALTFPLLPLESTHHISEWRNLHLSIHTHTLHSIIRWHALHHTSNSRWSACTNALRQPKAIMMKSFHLSSFCLRVISLTVLTTTVNALRAFFFPLILFTFGLSGVISNQTGDQEKQPIFFLTTFFIFSAHVCFG